MAQVQSLVGEMQLTEMKSQWSSIHSSSNVTVSLGAQSASSAQRVLSLLQGRWACDLRMQRVLSLLQGCWACDLRMQGVLSLLQGRWVCDLRMHCPKLPFM